MSASDFFNSPIFKAFNKRPTMDEFLALRKRFGRFVIKTKIITFARYGLGQG